LVVNTFIANQLDAAAPIAVDGVTGE